MSNIKLFLHFNSLLCCAVRLLRHYRLEPTRLLCPWGFSREEYWNGLPCPPSGDLPTQGSNPGLLHCTWNLYRLSHQGSPFNPLSTTKIWQPFFSLVLFLHPALLYLFCPCPTSFGPFPSWRDKNVKVQLFFQCKSSEQRQPLTIDIKPFSCSELRAIVKVFPKSVEKFTEEFKIVLGGLPGGAVVQTLYSQYRWPRFNSLSAN